jgi:hypothetical protein
MRNLLDRAIALQAERITAEGSTVDGDEVRMLRPSDLAETGGTLARTHERTGQYL